jgi:hypothetical protein
MAALRLMRFCNRGVIQFVLVKPIVATVDIFLLAYSSYHNNKTWKIIESVLYNVSYSVALYCLMVFYLATKKQLQKYKPVYKFLSVKGLSTEYVPAQTEHLSRCSQQLFLPRTIKACL